MRDYGAARAISDGGTASRTAAAALTALGVLTGMSLGAYGYYRLPGGITLQWGTVSGSSDIGIAFPVAFSAAPWALTMGVDSNNAQGAYLYAAERDGITATGFNFRGRYVVSGGTVGTVAIPATWFALGPT